MGFLSNIIENHDEPRGASIFLPDYAQNDDGVKMLATASLLLRGVPFIYQGQEIGMRNFKARSIEEFDDLNTKDQYELALRMGCTEQEALACCNRMSRDNARRPMQWNAEDNAGFTTGTPWLQVNPDYTKINVQGQESDPDSVLNYYRKLTALRKDPRYVQTFTYGRFVPVRERIPEQVLAYLREDEQQKILVLGNWSEQTMKVSLENDVKEVLLNNQKAFRINEKGQVELQSCQALVLLL